MKRCLAKLWIYSLLVKSGPIRPAKPEDAQQCLDIYRYYAENTAFSFEENAPTVEQMAQRIADISRIYPWLVYEQDQVVLGYAYASQFRPRPAYRWSVEVTIYLDDKAKRLDIARQLYQELFAVLIKLGYYNALAVITEPNPESERFHLKLGFRKIGTFESIGYKLNQWNDIGWWQKQLQPVESCPVMPLAVNILNGLEQP